MEFLSTRNRELSMSFQQALFQGLAPDGGLFYPSRTVDMSELFKTFNEDTPFNTIAEEVFYTLLEGSITKDISHNIVNNAFNFEPVIKKISNNISILELYHGPSCAFKDFGASFLASSMEEFLTEGDKEAVILTATSGDTGSAVAQAFHGKRNIQVVILYPKGRVSPLQEKQLTTLGDNITALEVKGSFDDCQKMVKEAFTDKELKSKINLSSANSINLGRLIPQSFYYIWNWAQRKEDKITFCVPSGNFGNLTAGLYAESWGLPVEHFIAATNKNDVIPEFLNSGIFSPRPSVHTYSNAMDVGNPSNFERLYTLFEENVSLFKDKMSGIMIDDEKTLSTISRVFKERGYLMCPHTAVGYLAAEQFISKNPNKEISVLSTAHPGKFVEVVQEATGKSPQLPEALQKLINKEKVSIITDNTTEALKDYLLKNMA